MKLILSALLTTLVSLQLLSQVALVLPENYYEDYFLQVSNNACYGINLDPKTNFCDSLDVYEGYTELRVLPYSPGAYRLREDDEGVFLPYDLTEGEKYHSSMQREMLTDMRRKMREHIEFVDTINILRDNPAPTPILNRSRRKATPFEFFRFYILDTARFGYQRAEENFVSIFVEVRENDLIAPDLRRRIICPTEISRELVKELNQKLIDLGYLKDEYRRIYAPEIRNAIGRLQKNRKLPKGFLDLETLEELEVDPNLYRLQLLSPLGYSTY